MQQKEYLYNKDIFRTLEYMDNELMELGVLRKFNLYSIGGTKLMLENIKPSSRDLDFVVARKDFLALSEIVAEIKYEKGIVIDLFKDGNMPGYKIPDYQNKSKKLSYHFNKLNLFCLGDLTFAITKIIASRRTDLEDLINFFKVKDLSEKSLRKRFSEFILEQNKSDHITLKFENFLENYFD